MSNEYKSVPVESDHIHQMAFEEGQPAENGDGYSFTSEEFDLFVERLLTAAAPQPPALGGEPGTIWDVADKAIKEAYPGETLGFWGAQRIPKFGLLRGAIARIEHDSRAHLAPLQAEIERVTALCIQKDERMEAMNKSWAGCITERDRLKARCDELENLMLDLVTQHDLPMAARNLCNAALSKPAGGEHT